VSNGTFLIVLNGCIYPANTRFHLQIITIYNFSFQIQNGIVK